MTEKITKNESDINKELDGLSENDRQLKVNSIFGNLVEMLVNKKHKVGKEGCEFTISTLYLF